MQVLLFTLLTMLSRRSASMLVSSAARKCPGGDFVVTEHRIEVPLDWEETDGEKISVFVREVGQQGGSTKPFLLYLQGGPGFPSPRPSVPLSGWLKSAVEKYRVLLLDQRGTGQSSRVTCSNARLESLQHYRSDSIVRDCESIREALCGGEKLTLLAQSYGGFCALSYLSTFPRGVEKALFTCGLAPVGVPIDDVYRATFDRMEARCHRFYSRYPEDVEVVRDIVRELDLNPRPLPRGGTLTARRFLQLGLLLGSSNGLESLHHLLEEANTNCGGASTPNVVLCDEFLNSVERAQEAFETNPIYYLLHEPIYVCSNTQPLAGQWSAERVQTEMGDKWNYRTRLETGDAPVLLTGEHVFSWMTEDYAWLKNLKPIADQLATKTDWNKPLYDVEKLRSCDVPCAALVSYDDIYVERLFSEQTAHFLGGNIRCWITNEFQHSGLRDQPGLVFDRLEQMAQNNLQY